ncbi:pro-sigmaK processing inhibitor BofA family protein [Methanococcoides sp. FTZ1]|uniref:pro-sigmaK processing inhibitor BofA family protein n=1 Tax=Methanococcoides sp. FTZ1 TaxID=3439061 RepID=UPI003F84070C
MVVEIIVVLVAIIIALLLYKVLKTVKNMIVNTVLGVILLLIANFALGLDIAFTWVTILVCALAGIVGALLIVLLAYLGIFF